MIVAVPRVPEHITPKELLTRTDITSQFAVDRTVDTSLLSGLYIETVLGFNNIEITESTRKLIAEINQLGEEIEEVATTAQAEENFFISTQLATVMFVLQVSFSEKIDRLSRQLHKQSAYLSPVDNYLLKVKKFYAPTSITSLGELFVADLAKQDLLIKKDLSYITTTLLQFFNCMNEGIEPSYDISVLGDKVKQDELHESTASITFSICRALVSTVSTDQSQTMEYFDPIISQLKIKNSSNLKQLREFLKFISSNISKLRQHSFSVLFTPHHPDHAQISQLFLDGINHNSIYPLLEFFHLFGMTSVGEFTKAYRSLSDLQAFPEDRELMETLQSSLDKIIEHCKSVPSLSTGSAFIKASELPLVISSPDRAETEETILINIKETLKLIFSMSSDTKYVFTPTDSASIKNIQLTFKRGQPFIFEALFSLTPPEEKESLSLVLSIDTKKNTVDWSLLDNSSDPSVQDLKISLLNHTLTSLRNIAESLAQKRVEKVRTSVVSPSANSAQPKTKRLPAHQEHQPKKLKRKHLPKQSRPQIEDEESEVQEELTPNIEYRVVIPSHDELERLMGKIDKKTKHGIKALLLDINRQKQILGLKRISHTVYYAIKYNSYRIVLSKLENRVPNSCVFQIEAIGHRKEIYSDLGISKLKS